MSLTMYSKMYSKRFAMTTFILFLLFSVNSVAANDPAEQTQALVNSLKAVDKNNVASYKNVDQYIDYSQLTNNSIKPIRSKFTDQQAQIFTQDFEKLIRMIAYPQSSTFYKDAKAVYNDPVINGDTALVVSEAVIKKEDFDIEIGYQWKKSTKGWLMTDLILDEDSLVKDYQNQFSRIVSKEGVEGLLKKIKNKIIEVEKEN